MGGYTRLFGYLTRDVLAPKDSARRYLFMAALQGVSESRFMGLGTGGFASFLGVEYRQYPHNLLLEVLAEQGFVGFMMVATMMLITTFRVVRYRNHIGPMQRVIVSGWVFGLVNALVSGDIGTNSMFWVIGGLIWNLSVDMHLPRIDESSEQRLIDYRMVDNHDQSE
jgi:O-antigen ligase